MDHTAELNTPVVVPWTEVVKRNNHKGKLCHRPEAVMVQAEGLTFTDMLKKVKADREVQAVSANFTGIDMTRAGHLRSFTTNKERKTGKLSPERYRTQSATMPNLSPLKN